MTSKMVSEFLKMKREERQLSQTELAQVAGVSFRSVQNIEANKSVKEDTVNKVAKALGYTLKVTYELVELPQGKK